MDQELVNYFIEQSNKRLDKIEDKIDTLIKFKWQIIGGALIAGFMSSIVVSFGVQIYLN